MKRLTRIGLAVLGGLSAVLAAAGGGVLVWSRQPFPPVTGRLRVPDLLGDVEIVRDRFGVPHIYADTSDDLFFAQGFVHAQDRFFQMEFWRRIGQGRLAELFGESALNQDRFIRTIGWRRVAEQEFELLDPSTRRALERYAAGVNAYVMQNPDRLGLEFRVLGLIGRRWSPEPWTPADSLTWGKVMAYNLGGNMETEIVRAALIRRGGQELADAVLPPYPADGPYIVEQPVADPRAPSAIQTELPSTVSSLDALKALRAMLDGLGLRRHSDIGSNNWVVSGERTTTGKPLLANDPHLGIQMPSIWYQVGLHCRQLSEACPYDVVGASFAGAPGVIIGHNRRIAWGVTNVGPDVQDVFIERPDPADPDRFEFKGQFEPAQVFEERIIVAGRSEPVVLRVRVTRHGPILNDVVSELKDEPPMALQWTALKPGALLRSVLMLNRASNWDDFRAALRYWDTPAQNFVYADVDGNIGYQMPGRIPIRAAGDGRTPVPGWSGEYEWIDEVPFESLPSVFNPPQGVIVTANHAVIDPRNYPYLLGTDWDHGFRARRILQLLGEKDRLSLEDMQRIQNDIHSLYADDVLPALSTLAPTDATAADALRRMQEWDRRSSRDSVGALIFETFWTQLAHAIFDDELGEDLAGLALGVSTETREAVRRMLADPNAPWWDDATTPQRESQTDILLRALSKTVERLRARFGNNLDDWRWGRAHQVTFSNQTLGRSGVRVIESIFNRGPFEADGASAAVNNIGGGDESFRVTTAPSWRMIVDLDDLNRSLAVHTTGQSGHAFHPHYDDMIPLWLNGRYNPLVWQRDDVLKDAEGTLVLERVGAGQ
ncbi:MAG: penicillin acylase family protein [Anaerolineae bacterium]|nr:penicillin acylase family protein [Thermoflexales bacterium]MDW8407809.1 penicillin acylase family protein [Anaerolineae bacterium]